MRNMWHTWLILHLHCKLCLCCTGIHCLLLLNVHSQSNHCALFGAHKHINFECFWSLSNHTNLYFCCWRWLLIFVSPFWEDTCGTHFVCVWNTCWAWKWNEWVVVWVIPWHFKEMIAPQQLVFSPACNGVVCANFPILCSQNIFLIIIVFGSIVGSIIKLSQNTRSPYILIPAQYTTHYS